MAHRAPPNLWVPNSPEGRACIQQVLTRHLWGTQDPKTRPPPSLWGTHRETEAAGAGPPPWFPRAVTAAGCVMGGHRRCHRHPTSGPPDCSPARAGPSPDSSAEVSGPRAMMASQSTHAVHAQASGPLGPAKPQASSLSGRRVQGSGSRQPGLHQPPALPASGRAEAWWPGLLMPRLVKPAQQHPRPRCCQRLEPAQHGAPGCPNSLPRESKHDKHLFAQIHCPCPSPNHPPQAAK